MNPTRASRLVFIDWLRGFSILFMIETHVFNSLLKPFLKEEGWFHLLNFFNGLVAPSFLFVSGWAFVVASTRKLEDLHKFGPAFWQQLKRIGLIWILGYTLHLPGFAFSALRQANNAAAWQTVLQVDVLHCIAAGLSLLFLIRMLVKSEDRFGMLLWVGVLFVVLLTPWVWASEWLERLPPAVSGYWAERAYTLFPQFPWLGFLLLGGACATTYKHADEAGTTVGFMRRTAIVGMVLIAVGYAFARYGFPWPYGSSSIRAHPVFFALRVGYVFLWVWACWQLQRHPAIPSGWIMTLSRESLLVYVAHIVFLYHLPLGNASLARIYGRSLSLWECAGVTVALMLLMWGMALSWSWLKSRHKPGSQYLAYAAGAGAAILFLTR
jgi:uncharacterized membrane protein